ncbi:MAG: hypothetical protein RQ982_05465 [Gammaproteobacteria bacterium]|nr:hypothetical protein [Gammaproteobacteria bacterium]
MIDGDTVGNFFDDDEFERHRGQQPYVLDESASMFMSQLLA